MPYIESADISKAHKQEPKKVKPALRVLHIVGGMNRGGTETWLMNILRNIDGDRFQFDFLVHTDQPCHYDAEIRALGHRIIPCVPPSQPWLYTFQFLRILREYGPYDIIHSHIHYFSGYVLYLAKKAGIPVRIVHSHTSLIEKNIGFKRRLYLTLMKWGIARYATLFLAGSYQAGLSLFGSPEKTKPRWQVVNYGIDMTPFLEFVEPISIRSQLGLPQDAFVIGHVGRFEPVKNHLFLLEIAAEVVKREPKAYFLLIGDGSLRPNIEQQVIQLGLQDHVVFTGVRSDVSRLMLGAMDVFVFPSIYEGLGLVSVEAQAAGLPCIFADVIPQEADVIEPLIQRLSLSKPASDWAEAILNTKNVRSRITQSKALSLLLQSEFNLSTCITDLEKLYLKQFSTDSHSQLEINLISTEPNPNPFPTREGAENL